MLEEDESWDEEIAVVIVASPGLRDLNKRKTLFLYDLRDPRANERSLAWRNLIFFGPLFGLLFVQSLKQLNIEGVIGPITNSTASRREDLQHIASDITNFVRQNVTSAPNPAIPVS